jgi:phosphatidylserine/phosphatidylglycerophosphate/cardiolipin synthase-like enzyme
MKLYEAYKKVVQEIKPIKKVWFTTFNMDPELVEKYLVSVFVDKDPSELKTAEDFETLNTELNELDIKVFYDYRALNIQSQKYTSIDLIPVNPAVLYNVDKTDAVFHPKVIFLSGEKGTYLIAGSANLSISAWSSNRESVIIRKVQSKKNIRQVLRFFEQLPDYIEDATLENHFPEKASDWDFIQTLSEGRGFNLFDHINPDNLTIWSPYFSREVSGFLRQLQDKGFQNIQLVPHINEHGKIGITQDEIKTIQDTPNLLVYRQKQFDERQGLHHAKVWLTEHQLAIGSWNCSKRATGFNIKDSEKNIEAGIILTSDQGIQKSLLNAIEPINADVKGMNEQELDKEWEQVLNPYTFSIQIQADWDSFQYKIEDNTKSFPHQYSVSLPDMPTDYVSLKEIHGKSFRANYVRLLKNKTFTVVNENRETVFMGYLQEKGKKKRPVYSYVNINDLMQSLIDDPTGKTTRQQCNYRLPAEIQDGDDYDHVNFHYSGSASFYLMFVSFRKLFDSILDHRDDAQEMDKLGFRLPGSVLNIRSLVKESINEALKQEEKSNTLLFHYFLGQEANRCIQQFNEYSKEKIQKLEDFYFDRLKKKMGFQKQDNQFLAMIRKEFNYG